MATLAAAKHQGPVYLRFARQASPIFTVTKQTFIIGRAKILIPGKDITIIGIGPLLYEAILAARELAKKGIRAEIINSSSIKPLDAKTILASVKKTGRAITLEDHQIHGGLGSAVAELLSQSLPRPLKIMGVSDQFGQSGQAEELWEKHQLTHPYIIQHALKLLKK